MATAVPAEPPLYNRATLRSLVVNWSVADLFGVSSRSSEQYCSQWNFNTDGFIGLVAVSTAPNPGRDVCCGRRQSMPSSKYPSCAAVIVTVRSAPSRGAVDGQTKRPRSSRFANRHRPWPSIALERLLYQQRQPVEALAHVGVTGRQPHLHVT